MMSGRVVVTNDGVIPQIGDPQTRYFSSLLECRVKVGRYEVSIQIDHFEQIAPQQKVFLSFSPDHGPCLAE